ncbi:hypothetical protein SAMN05444397_104260 [Flavobacterium aquidurense]|uniref:NlpE N-terminal domain-containing protein n=1 Tax=Flavobacterium frigidimaris TaxID=262320 RepID=A0ABX4BMY7_FLAFR|nr:hypothetical protein [Flavobacterium frigidimaris]OXA77109.1 hypothetical protein B0A65_17570 [Flavobacterium frigidimaris]SDZ22987.1 hypothetical protein SAMN05444397_104260 [Flavobacterium aquidurense]
MKKALLSLLFFLSIIIAANAQTSKSNLYKGTIDGKIAVTFFIKTEENPCTADLMYTAMYRYDKSGSWIQLDITQNTKNENQFALVEHSFTGLMILKKEETTFSGLWISSDSKKQLKVELKEAKMTKKETESYEAKMEKVNYENNDC